VVFYGVYVTDKSQLCLVNANYDFHSVAFLLLFVHVVIVFQSKNITLD
jgi:hypothetical protein